MKTAMKLKKSDVKEMLALTFPDYTGRKFSLVLTHTVTFFDMNWGGGSRNVYKCVNTAQQTAQVPAPAPWVNPLEGMTVELPLDTLVAEHSVFCGKDLGITFYMRPENAPALLNAPAQ